MHIKYTIIIFVNSNRLLEIKLVLTISAFKRFFGFRTASPTSWFERWKRQKIRPRTAAKLGEQPLKVSCCRKTTSSLLILLLLLILPLPLLPHRFLQVLAVYLSSTVTPQCSSITNKQLCLVPPASPVRNQPC